MRIPTREVLLAATLVGFASFGTASAQSVGVEVHAGASPYYYSERSDGYYRYAPPPAPRVYGYSREAVGPDVVVPLRPSNCGEFHYWNGVRCADARVEPPNLK